MPSNVSRGKALWPTSSDDAARLRTRSADAPPPAREQEDPTGAIVRRLLPLPRKSSADYKRRSTILQLLDDDSRREARRGAVSAFSAGWEAPSALALNAELGEDVRSEAWRRSQTSSVGSSFLEAQAQAEAAPEARDPKEEAKQDATELQVSTQVESRRSQEEHLQDTTAVRVSRRFQSILNEYGAPAHVPTSTERPPDSVALVASGGPDVLSAPAVGAPHAGKEEAFAFLEWMLVEEARRVDDLVQEREFLRYALVCRNEDRQRQRALSDEQQVEAASCRSEAFAAEASLGRLREENAVLEAQLVAEREAGARTAASLDGMKSRPCAECDSLRQEAATLEAQLAAAAASAEAQREEYQSECSFLRRALRIAEQEAERKSADAGDENPPRPEQRARRRGASLKAEALQAECKLIRDQFAATSECSASSSDAQRNARGASPSPEKAVAEPPVLRELQAAHTALRQQRTATLEASRIASPRRKDGGGASASAPLPPRVVRAGLDRASRSSLPTDQRAVEENDLLVDGQAVSSPSARTVRRAPERDGSGDKRQTVKLSGKGSSAQSAVKTVDVVVDVQTASLLPARVVRQERCSSRDRAVQVDHNGGSDERAVQTDDAMVNGQTASPLRAEVVRRAPERGASGDGKPRIGQTASPPRAELRRQAPDAGGGDGKPQAVRVADGGGTAERIVIIDEAVHEGQRGCLMPSRLARQASRSSSGGRERRRVRILEPAKEEQPSSQLPAESAAPQTPLAPAAPPQVPSPLDGGGEEQKRPARVEKARMRKIHDLFSSLVR
eukprot:TRINITY_DN8817_c0_g1_i1.p1 TRINITY_DN8817_c0_g1~~TRINITY_DN8817_c0_g1_i1.p1  ORF type:complete len:791 (+),score=198.19 TRINITY_DN8817_c0_g1_i1:151-2523(+)